jgi:hypothetical protein
MPGIVMTGTLPTFFKIPVTQSLLYHIACGIRPPKETRVTYCFPLVPARRRTEGMKPLDNRREILKCFEAFKAIVGNRRKGGVEAHFSDLLDVEHVYEIKYR